jgi:hypothetical protein
MSFTNFSFVVISSIIKQKNTSLGIFWVGKVNDWRWIARLKRIIIDSNFDITPCFSLIFATLQDNINISKIATSVDSPSAKANNSPEGKPIMAGILKDLCPSCPEVKTGTCAHN